MEVAGAGVSKPPDRLAHRRASLLIALRDGDVHAAARAWSRLRGAGATLTKDELAAAKAARMQVGRALRIARERRAADASIVAVPSPPATAALRPSSSRRRVIVALLIATVAAVAVVARAAALSPAGSVAPAAAVASPASAVETEGGGRGRIEATVPPQAAAPVRSPSPSESVSPSVTAAASALAAPSPTPAPAATPALRPGPTGPAAVVVPPPPLSTAVATPAASLYPPPLASGYSRIRVLVVDATTLAPIAGACVSLGGTDCGPSRWHTNALGLWWFDFETGSIAGQQWAVTITRDGYQPLSVTVTTTGRDQDFPAALQPVR